MRKEISSIGLGDDTGGYEKQVRKQDITNYNDYGFGFYDGRYSESKGKSGRDKLYF